MDSTSAPPPPPLMAATATWRKQLSRWSVWHTYAALALAIILLIAGSDILLDMLPVHVHVTGSASTASVTVDGKTRTIQLDRPLRAVRVVPVEPYRREYQIDGSDSTNNFTFEPAHFARIAPSAYYRFQAWLRDEGSYSQWRNLVVQDSESLVWIRQARPEAGEPIQLPPSFRLSLQLRRIETPRLIELVDETNSSLRISVDRNDKQVRIARTTPAGQRQHVANWYFPLDWPPALALNIYMVMRTCAVAVALILLLAPVAALMPAVPAWRPGRHTATVVPLLAFAVALAGMAYISATVFDKTPHIQDGISYYFQARILAAGSLAAPAPPVPEAFPTPFTVIHAGKWFSMYTPGTPLLIAAGFLVGLPWLVGPLLGAAAILITFGFARQQFGIETALLVAVLMASSPFLYLQAGTFMSHVPAMFFGAGVVYATTRYVHAPARRWVVLGACALGFLLLVREMSAILYGLGAGVAVILGLRRLSHPRWPLADAALAVACLAIFAGASLYNNWVLTGSPFLLPRTLFSPVDNRYGFGEGVGFYGQHTLAAGLINADAQLTSLAFTLFGWPFYIALALMLLPFITRRASAWDFLHAAIAALFILAYVGLYYHGITYGPRYYLDGLPSFVLLTARGFVALAGVTASMLRSLGRPHARARARIAALGLCGVLLACNGLYFAPRQLQLYSYLSNRQSTDSPLLGDFIDRTLAGRVGNRPNAVIATYDRSLYWNTLSPMNCPRLDCPSVFAYLPSNEAEQRLRALFSGRTWYIVEDRGGVLTIRPE